MCPRPDQMCVGEMAKIDARGGATGEEAEANYKRLQYDNRLAERVSKGRVATSRPRRPARTVRRSQGMKPRPDMGNPDVRGQKSPDSQGKGSGEGQSEGGSDCPQQLNKIRLNP